MSQSKQKQIVPMSPWHQHVVDMFSHANGWHMHDYLKRITGTPWYKAWTEQSVDPDFVRIMLRDANKRYTPVFVHVTPTSSGFKIQTGQARWIRSTSVPENTDVRATIYVPQNALPGATIFDWIESDGLDIDRTVRLTESADRTPLKTKLMGLRSAMARAAQKVYNDWEQDDDGMSDEYGCGGICTQIADAITDVIASRVRGVDFHEGGHDGDDHAWSIVTDGKEAYGVDIDPYTYESGGGYNWSKINGVRFTANDIDIFPINVKDLQDR